MNPLIMLGGIFALGYVSKNYFSESKIAEAEAQGEKDQKKSTQSATKQVEITFASELAEGEMRELEVGAGKDDKVLIARYNGRLHSVGNYCSHFGAPLGSTGMLFDDKVVCPWHAAAFSVVTGAPEAAPALDGLPKFEIIEKEDDEGNTKYFVEVP